MTIAATNIGTNTNGGTASTSVAISSVTVPAGADILVAVLMATGFSGLSCSDPTNGSYTQVTSVNLNNASANGTLFLFRFAGSASLSGSTITASWTGSVKGMISALYVTGQASASALDTAVTNTSFGASASPTITSGTPGVSGELLIGAMGNGGGPTFTQASGWSAPFNEIQNPSTLAGGNKVNSGSSAQTYNPSLSVSENYGMIIIGIKPADVLMAQIMI